MAEQEPRELADDLQREADSLERHSQKLGEQTEAVRQEWERKRADSKVPGAPPSESGGEGSGEEPEAEFPAKAESREDNDD